MNNYRLAFICVNFNNFTYTEKFCESLARQKNLNSKFRIECIIVDNSTDDTDLEKFLEIKKKYSWVQYLRAPKNLGYFGGLNYGLKSIVFENYFSVVICNNDLYFDEYFCEKLCITHYGQDVYAVCPDVVTDEDFHQNPHVLRKMSWLKRLRLDLYFSHYYLASILSFVLRIVRPRKKSPVLPTIGREIHMGIGACYVLTLHFLRQFKQLSYPHFLYGEEAYFSDQIHSVSGILWFDPNLLVHHAESATLSKIPKRTVYEYARTSYPGYREML